MWSEREMRKSKSAWTWILQMMHTSVLILFIQPVNKVKTSLGSSFPAHWLRFMAVLPAQCRRGLSAVITPVGNQRPAELKDPWLDGRCGALRGRPTVKLPAAHGDCLPRAAVPPAKPLLIEVQPPVGPSQRDRGKRSVLNNYYVT